MKLHNIAINNLRRRKARMAFLAAGVVIGVATIVTLYTITSAMKLEIADRFDRIGANMTVVPRSESLSMSYEGVSVSDTGEAVPLMSMSDMEKIRTIRNKENIAIVAPKLLDTVMVDNRPRLVMGVRFADELRMKRWWKIEGRKPSGAGEILLGARAAADLGKKPGDVLAVKGLTYTVAGIIRETGGEEDGIVFMDLGVMQGLAGKPGAVSFVEVSALCSTCPIDEITAQIAARLPGTRVSAIRETVQARKDFVDRFSRMALAVSLIVLVIGSLVVLVTMMSAVNERTREIGIFRAIGFRRSHVIRIILMEAGIISFFSGVAGYLAGMAAAGVTAPVIARMDVNIAWDYRVGAVALFLALVMGLAAGLLPAVKAAGQDPVEALRFI